MRILTESTGERTPTAVTDRAGRLTAHEQGPKQVSAAIEAYLDAKRIRCSPLTIELEEERNLERNPDGVAEKLHEAARRRERRGEAVG
jgi:hypothetical protein